MILTLSRTLHTSLNRLITSRLPLALPPHTSDPSLYATGILHFAHIFLTFESLWADILRDYASPSSRSASAQSGSTSLPLDDGGIISPPTSPLLSYLLVNPYDSPSLFTSTLGAPTPPSPQLAAFLQTLRPKDLVRSGRLKKDLEYLLDLHPTDLEVLLAKYPGDRVAEFCTHIRKSVNKKPWTLVSYAWCFYMAIFSGGRWIRAGLMRAPPGFWPATREEEIGAGAGLHEKGLSFWHFAGAHDGEDIKAGFKERLAAAEGLFTPDERVDIIEEAKSIFQLCATLVEELDDTVGADRVGTDAAELPRDDKIDSNENRSLVEAENASGAPPTQFAKPCDLVTIFLRRPEVKGTIVALGCLACVTLACIIGFRSTYYANYLAYRGLHYLA